MLLAITVKGGMPSCERQGMSRWLHEAELSGRRDRSWCHAELAKRRRKTGEFEVHDLDATVKGG